MTFSSSTTRMRDRSGTPVCCARTQEFPRLTGSPPGPLRLDQRPRQHQWHRAPRVGDILPAHLLMLGLELLPFLLGVLGVLLLGRGGLLGGLPIAVAILPLI